MILVLGTENTKRPLRASGFLRTKREHEFSTANVAQYDCLLVVKLDKVAKL
jgi:hypothetical protein